MECAGFTLQKPRCAIALDNPCATGFARHIGCTPTFKNRFQRLIFCRRVFPSWDFQPGFEREVEISSGNDCRL